jgi:hypothetical protein
MHLIESYTKPEEMIRVGTKKPPFGPAFNAEDFEDADRLQVYGSSFADVGIDYCEFLIMKGTEILKRKKVEGY